MGHHYVPRRYLRNFEVREQPGRIWQYAKKDGTARCLPIKRIAQARDFYEPDMEEYLACEVEPQGAVPSTSSSARGTSTTMRGSTCRSISPWR